MRTLHLDFETYSGVDLKKVGVENYIRHPDFAVTAIAWAFDDNSVSALFYPHAALSPEVRAHIQAGGIIKAWNAAFEWNILTYAFGLNVSHEQMDCVMQRAAAFGLPLGLEKAGEALKAPIIKDATARRLMLTMGKPKKDGTAWHLDQSAKAQHMLKDLATYCKVDVEAERALDKMIPPLSKFEKALSIADAKINQKGVPVDLTGVLDLAFAAEEEIKLINAECERLTGGAVTSPGTQRDRLLAWLASAGFPLPDVTKETVAKALLHPLIHQHVYRVLELRQAAAKASVAKLAMMGGWASVHDGRARNLLQFYGAGRTARWAGRGIQVQNLPRQPKGWKTQNVMDLAHTAPGALRLFHVSPMDAISKSLRGCLTARPEHVLVSIDLSQIEARVLAWLAGQNDVLDQFRRGVDIYTNTATKHGSSDRQLGKVLVLACGFQMGAAKFRDTAEKDYGVTMTLAEATRHLDAWRRDNAMIVSYWKAVENMVWNAVSMGGEHWLDHGVAARMKNGHLELRKPNGCKLIYHNMRTSNGDLVFDGVNSKTKKWGVEKTYGGRLVENLVQSTARDVMASAILAAPTLPIMTVHDEIVWEIPELNHQYPADYLQQVVNTGTPWTAGLPIASELKISWRYSK